MGIVGVDSRRQGAPMQHPLIVQSSRFAIEFQQRLGAARRIAGGQENRVAEKDRGGVTAARQRGLPGNVVPRLEIPSNRRIGFARRMVVAIGATPGDPVFTACRIGVPPFNRLEATPQNPIRITAFRQSC